MPTALANPVPRPKVSTRPLSEGLSKIADAALVGPGGTHQELVNRCLVTGVTHDSSRVEPGDVFFALAGHSTHGAQFVADAVSKGAVAIVTDPLGLPHLPVGLDSQLPVIVTERAHESLGTFASWVYGNPSRRLKVIGVTGTNGKTTTVWFVAEAANAAGMKGATLGTTGLRFGDKSWSLGHTTPEASDLQAAFGLLVEMGVQVVAMEVSSHALALGRVIGTHFFAVGFTGLSQDHLDFHGDMDSYFAAKASLFRKEIADRGSIVIDTWGKQLASQTDIDCDTIGFVGEGANWQITQAKPSADGFEFDFVTPSQETISSQLGLWGDFNCLNAVLAIALAEKLGVAPNVSAQSLADVAVPGRMQTIRHEGGVLGVVDYAHTPEAIEHAINAVRAGCGGGRVIVVLGAGGDRDRSKRSAMGAAASGADLVFVTDDNPRTEEPAAIRAELMDGATKAGRRSDSTWLCEVGDRGVAIGEAVAVANPGDVVLVLGKGHERTQDVSGTLSDFDDFVKLGEALNGRGFTGESVGFAS